MTRFQQHVYDYVKTIPRGEIRTYQEVARAIGRPRSIRSVANALAKNYHPDIPCHRVIRSDGKLGGYNRGGEKVKRRILMREGVIDKL
jgi:methylated-DNA-[protein]-cysteine S-methyltransferase